MKNRKSVFNLLIFVMMFSLLLPVSAVNAGHKEPTPPEGTKGSLTIYKYERDPGVEDGEDGDGTADQKIRVPDDAKLLEGVTFRITKTHSFDPVNNKWKEFNGTNVIEVTTDVNGQAVFSNLSLGRYKVEEIDGPAHVILNDETYYVDIPMTSKDGANIFYDVHIYPKNETVRGSVKLKKKDGDNSKIALQGVKFKLFHADGKEVKKGNLHETDHRGYINVANLGFGDYYFQEVATRVGYVLGNSKVKFSITKEKHGKTVMVDVDNYKEPTPKKEVSHQEINRGEIITYTIKVDIPGDISSYKNFVVRDELDGNLEYVAESESHPSGFTFSKDGQNLTWTANPSELNGPGQIEITFEAKAKKDAKVKYIENKAYVDYKNKYNNGGTKETPKTKTELTDGGFKVFKVDSNKKHMGLKGAEFKLTDKDGNTIDASGTIITVNGVQYNGLLDGLVTDKNGEIKIDGLPVGTYYLVETKAPTYEEDGETKSYRLLANPIEVEITKNDSSKTKTVKVENSKSGWELPKTGGMGTLFFTLIGLIFMGSALYMYIRRRRADV